MERTQGKPKGEFTFHDDWPMSMLRSEHIEAYVTADQQGMIRMEHIYCCEPQQICRFLYKADVPQEFIRPELKKLADKYKCQMERVARLQVGDQIEMEIHDR